MRYNQRKASYLKMEIQTNREYLLRTPTMTVTSMTARAQVASPDMMGM